MSDLPAIIQRGIKLVECNSRGHLSRPERVVLLHALGPYVSGGDTPITTGHRTRARLAIECVRTVLPAWNQFLPADDWPAMALAAAEDLLRGEIDTSTAVRMRHAILKHSDKVEGDWEDRDLRILVCHAADAALCVALHDEWLGGEDGFPVEAEDDQLDPLDLDAAYLASVVVAKGFLSQPTSDVEQRRRFWLRYLTEHIPAAIAGSSG